MLVDDMQKADAKGQRLYSNDDIVDGVRVIIDDARAGGADDMGVIKALVFELGAMAQALRDAQDEIRQYDESTGRIIALLTKASNIANRKD